MVSYLIFSSPCLVIPASPSWSLNRPHCHLESSGFRFQRAWCPVIWSPLCTWPCSPSGCEQRIFHNNCQRSKFIPTNPCKEPREPKLFQMRCFCPKSVARVREAGAFCFVMNSDQGQEEVKGPLFSSQSLSCLVHSALELWGRKTQQRSSGRDARRLPSVPSSPRRSGSPWIGPCSFPLPRKVWVHSVCSEMCLCFYAPPPRCSWCKERIK